MFDHTKQLLDKYIANYSSMGLASSAYANVLKDVKSSLMIEEDNIKKNIQFKLSLHGKDSRLEVIEDVSFSLYELGNIVFIQPLTPLCVSDYDDLERAIHSNLDAIGKDKRVILIPYDIKLLTVKGLLPE